MVSVCLPSDALLQHLPSNWVSLTLGVGYLFTAAPAKCSCCSLDEGYLLTAPSWPWTWSNSSRPSCPHPDPVPWTWSGSSWPPPYLRRGGEKEKKKKKKQHLTLVICLFHLRTPSHPACYPLICFSRHLYSPQPCICCGIWSHKTHLRGHSRQWTTVYYTSRSKENQFPTRTLMFLRGPVLYPPPHPLLCDWLLVSNLFVVYDWVLQQIGARRTNN